MILNRIVFLILFFGISTFLISCNSYKRNKSFAQVPFQSIQKGEALAKRYCQSCHSLPDPSMLDAKTWQEAVLPVMGPMLGIFSYDFQRYPSAKNDRFLDSNYYPRKPVISSTEWQHILDYYAATSPDSMPPQQEKKTMIKSLPFFEARYPKPYNLHTVTYLSINADSGRHMMLADLSTQSLVKLNERLEINDSLAFVGTIADLVQGARTMVCDMGDIIPSNRKFGKGLYIRTGANGRMQLDSVPVFAGLARPVQIISTDLDKDGKADYLVCEFGFLTGDLSWYRNMGNDSFQRRIILAVPGAVKVYLRDENKDGLPDLWVLFAQGNEGIFLFTNKGNGQFDQQQILSFPPLYGSTSFQLVDYNKDGLEDIVYTCGDNADYSKVLKPYHGVYIFLNDGNNHFRQKYFYPINGCYKAIAADFDNDGDLDLATISFFADYARQPEEGFVYLENKGDFNFQPYTFPESQLGRWLTMDAGDLDGDGKIDLVLGNFAEGPVLMPHKADWKKGPSFIFLKNISKN